MFIYFFLWLIGFNYKWVCLRNFVIESAYDQRGKLSEVDSFFTFKIFRREKHRITRITAPSCKQLNKLSQLQNTQLNLFTVTFLGI